MIRVTRAPRAGYRRDRTHFLGRLETLEDRMLLADGITPAPGPNLTGTPGVKLSNVVVATFTIADSSGSPGSKWNARVDWGDNTANDKRLTPTQVGNTWEFVDSHTFAKAGTYTVTTHIAVPGSHKPNDNVVTLTATITSAPVLNSITVSPANPSVPDGLTEQFAATGNYSDGSTQDLTSQVTWVSATTSVATISNASGSQGLATTLAQGTSTISASLSGITGSTSLTVTAPVLQSVTVTPANPSVAAGMTEQFTATGHFSDRSTQNLTTQVTWASATTSVATISNASGKQGLATAVAAGTSSISATSGSVSGSTVLTVTAAALQSIAVTPANPSIPLGLTEQFTATGMYSDNSTKNLTTQVTWASATTSVATISNAAGSQGLATTLATGTSSISATLGGITGSTVLTVAPAALQSIAVTPPNPAIAKGTSEPFTATGTYSDHSTKDLTTQVTWASSATGVATITTAGVATGVAAGTSTISATLSGVSGSTVLTVSSATLTSISISPSNPSVPAGETQAFTATGTFSDNSTGDITNQVTWASATTSVATISNAAGSRGVATAMATGTSSISATLAGITASTVLTVSPSVLVTISVTPANPTIETASTLQFAALGTFSDHSTQDLTAQVTWSSGTTSVATISNSPGSLGLATGVAPGASSIKATLGTVTGSTVLTVTPTLVSIAVTPANPGLPKGETEQFDAVGTFSDHSTEDLTSQVVWSSGTASVATITAAGVATALATGTSTISASFHGITGSTVLTVSPAALLSIAVTPANPTIVQGGTEQFTATGTYSDHSTGDLTATATWASTAPGVATVNAAGLASGMGGGSATISASVGGISGQTSLTVNVPLVTLMSVIVVKNKRHQVTEIILDFSGALNASEAQSTAEYRLANPGKKGSFTAKNAKLIKLRSALYNPANDSVTLTPRKAFSLVKPVQVRVDGLAAGGLQDSLGRLIDGDHDGTPGGNAIAVIKAKGVMINAIALVRAALKRSH
jgi:hypothetical protein